MTTPPPALLAAAKAGNGWCCSCGKPNIDSTERSWKKRCSKCNDADAPATHCNECGDPLHLSLADFLARKRIRRAKCFGCKHNTNAPHPVYGVKCPQSWYATIGSPPSR